MKHAPIAIAQKRGAPAAPGHPQRWGLLGGEEVQALLGLGRSFLGDFWVGVQPLTQALP